MRDWSGVLKRQMASPCLWSKTGGGMNDGDAVALLILEYPGRGPGPGLGPGF